MVWRDHKLHVAPHTSSAIITWRLILKGRVMKKFFLLAVLLMSSQSAVADIFDRITDCETRSGASGCVYDLMRELASRPEGGSNTSNSYCECQVVSSERSGYCSINDGSIMYYFSPVLIKVLPNGQNHTQRLSDRSHGQSCDSSSANNNTACLAQMNTYSQCR